MLTEIGISLAEQGRKIATDLKQADDVLNALKSESPPTIRIGAGPLLAHLAMNDFVLRATQTGAPSSFDLQTGTARQLISDLLHGHLDMAVMATPSEMQVEHLRSIPLMDEHIGLFAGPKSPLAGSSTAVEGADIADAKWMAIEAAFGTTSSHENMLRKLGFAYAAPVIQFNMNIPGLLKALSASDALCFLPARLTRLLTEDTGISEIPIAVKSEPRQITIWHAADADLNSHLADVIKRCHAFLTGRLAGNRE